MADLKPPPLSLATRDGRLRVDFHWQDDRFVHCVSVDQQEAAASIEGGANDPWPSSPPIQQLSRQEINGANVILGVGAAGRSHWSISVELDRDEDAGQIKFDLACRCSEEPRFLGSSYRVVDSILITPLHADLVVDGQTNTIQAAVLPGKTHRWGYRLSIAK